MQNPTESNSKTHPAIKKKSMSCPPCFYLRMQCYIVADVYSVVRPKMVVSVVNMYRLYYYYYYSLNSITTI